MRTKLRSLLKSDESKGFATLLTGNVLVSVISLIFYPILTRLYSPVDFGIFASFIVVMAFLSLLSSFQLHSFVPIPSSRGEARRLIQNSIGLLIVFSSLILCVCLILYFSKTEVAVKGQVINSIILFLPFYTLLVGINEIFKVNNIRNKNFYYNAKATNLNRISANIMKLLFSLSFRSVGLVLGDIIGLIISLFLHLKTVPRELIYPKIEFAFIKKYMSRGVFSTYSAILNQLIIDLPMILVGSLFSVKLMGAFLVSYKVVLQPSLILGSSLSGSVFRKMNELHSNSGLLAAYIKNVIKKIMVIMIPICLLFSYFTQDVFDWLLGGGWEDSGQFAKYFVILIPFKVLSALTYNIYLTVDKVGLLALKKTMNISLILLVFYHFKQVSDIMVWLVSGEVLISSYFCLLGLHLINNQGGEPAS